MASHDHLIKLFCITKAIKSPFSTFREFSDLKSTLFPAFTDLQISAKILTPKFAISRTLMHVPLVVEWEYRNRIPFAVVLCFSDLHYGVH